MVDWKPSASLQNLQQRAYVLAKIRRFFSERAVLEVETPLLASSTVPDGRQLEPQEFSANLSGIFYEATVG